MIDYYILTSQLDFSWDGEGAYNHILSWGSGYDYCNVLWCYL